MKLDAELPSRRRAEDAFRAAEDDAVVCSKARAQLTRRKRERGDTFSAAMVVQAMQLQRGRGVHPRSGTHYVYNVETRNLPMCVSGNRLHLLKFRLSFTFCIKNNNLSYCVFPRTMQIKL